ncbi:hypothetical protein [Alloyangia pacifica]|uniref:hypothetical protein n=1 Tax=Alloyangia pacifica TaxID=311180 RepID=UPI001CD2577A|nr:hypothetical protein [Alloyangia pacifica]MCA0996498.1 hypothetical protein [Alloyangia pacifica]
MSMGDPRFTETNDPVMLGLRVLTQMVGFLLALSAFALWLMPEASEGLSLWRLGVSLLLLIVGLCSVFGLGRRD